MTVETLLLFRIDTIGLCVWKLVFLAVLVTNARKSSVSELLDYTRIIKSRSRRGMCHCHTWNWHAVLLRNQVKIAYLFCAWTYKEKSVVLQKVISGRKKKLLFHTIETQTEDTHRSLLRCCFSIKNYVKMNQTLVVSHERITAVLCSGS